MTDYDTSDFTVSGKDVSWSWAFAAVAVFAVATVVLPFLAG